MEERRKYPRLYTSFPVECNILAQKIYFYTVSRDLSLGGIKILTNEFIPRDYLIKLRINLIDEIISLKARVAWCNRKRISERYLVGLEFVEMNEKIQRNIFKFLNRVCTVQFET